MPEETRIRIVMVDDHPMVLKGIQACLEDYEDLKIIASVGSAEEMLEIWNNEMCDVVLLDMNLGGLNGFQAAEILSDRAPHIGVLIFSMEKGAEYVRSAVQSGASGYLLKDAMPSELVHAIRTVHSGGTYFAGDLVVSLSQHDRGPPDVVLTDREHEVLKQLSSGGSGKDIARALGISLRTVDAHRSNIRAKLGGKTSAECVQIALSNGLL